MIIRYIPFCQLAVMLYTSNRPRAKNDTFNEVRLEETGIPTPKFNIILVLPNNNPMLNSLVLFDFTNKCFISPHVNTYLHKYYFFKRKH